MPDTNGSKIWLRWLVGAVWVVFIAVIFGTINGVIANDKLSRSRDNKLNDKVVLIDKEIGCQLSNILIQITEIGTKQGIFMERQSRLINKVEDIEKKVN